MEIISVFMLCAIYMSFTDKCSAESPSKYKRDIDWEVLEKDLWTFNPVKPSVIIPKDYDFKDFWEKVRMTQEPVEWPTLGPVEWPTLDPVFPKIPDGFNNGFTLPLPMIIILCIGGLLVLGFTIFNIWRCHDKKKRDVVNWWSPLPDTYTINVRHEQTPPTSVHMPPPYDTVPRPNTAFENPNYVV